MHTHMYTHAPTHIKTYAQNVSSDIWLYCLAPSLGGVLAGLVFRFTADPRELADEEHQAKFFFANRRVCEKKTSKMSLYLVADHT